MNMPSTWKREAIYMLLLCMVILCSCRSDNPSQYINFHFNNVWLMCVQWFLFIYYCPISYVTSYVYVTSGCLIYLHAVNPVILNKAKHEYLPLHYLIWNTKNIFHVIYSISRWICQVIIPERSHINDTFEYVAFIFLWHS